jgi:scyllo-inositol 2-dehydrogenase (NADP+)
LAKKQNKKLSVYQNRRYDSDYKTIKKVLAEKLLGDLAEAEFHFDRYSENIGPKLHKEIPGPGTGSLYDLGSHLIDQALQLFGMPDAIFADIRIVRPVSKVEDYFDLLLYYPKLRVRIKSSYLVREPLPGYILHGAKGSFIKPKTNIQEESLQQNKVPGKPDWGIEPESERGLLHTEKDGKVIKEYIPSERGNYADFYNAMYEAIRNDKPVPVLAEDGLNIIKIIEAGFKSNNEKRVVEI